MKHATVDGRHEPDHSFHSLVLTAASGGAGEREGGGGIRTDDESWFIRRTFVFITLYGVHVNITSRDGGGEKRGTTTHRRPRILSHVGMQSKSASNLAFGEQAG